MLVSAVVPSYNRAHMIGKTIGSILNQTYRVLEVIIVDDGSTDDTEKVVLEYTRSSSIPIKYFKKPNGDVLLRVIRGLNLQLVILSLFSIPMINGCQMQ